MTNRGDLSLTVTPLYKQGNGRLQVLHSANDIVIGIYNVNVKFLLSRNKQDIRISSGSSPVKVAPILSTINP